MDAPHVSVLIGGWDLASGRTPEATLNAAREAERVGIDGIAVGDHVSFFGRGNDGLTTLTAIAAVTSTIQLKTCVYLLALRHPVPVALQVAQLDQLSLGRFVLGVGIGGEDRHEFEACGVDPRHRGARTDESIEILRRLWTEDDVSHDGRHFQIDRVSVNPRPIASVPIFIGGRSEAALRRAGRLGDGYTGIWQSPERFRELQTEVADHAVAADRDPGAIEFGMQFWTAMNRDTAIARAMVGGAMEGMYRTPFERFEKYTPYGKADEIAEFVLPYVEAGASHVNFIPAGDDTPEEGIEAAAAIREALHRLCRQA